MERDRLLSFQDEKQGTKMSAFLGIMSTMAGAGILALPGAFAKTGLLVGTLLLATMSVLTWVSVHYLCHCSDVTHEYSYEGLSRKLLRPREIWSTRILTLILLIGAQAMYLVIALDLLLPLLPSCSRNTLAVIYTILVLPLNLPESIHALRYMNAAALLALAYIALLIVWRTITGGIDLPSSNEVVLLKEVPSWIEVLNHISLAVPIIGLSFGCQVNSIRAYDELADKREMRSVNTYVVVIGFSFYFFFAVAGYICFNGNPPDDVLTGFAQDDSVINTARAGLALCMLLKTPIVFQPFRQILQLCMYDEKRPGICFNAITTIGAATLVCCIGVTCTSLGLVMDLMGSLAGLWIAFSVPGLFLWQVVQGKSSTLPAIGLVAAGILLTLLSLNGLFHTS